MDNNLFYFGFIIVYFIVLISLLVKSKNYGLKKNKKMTEVDVNLFSMPVPKEIDVSLTDLAKIMLNWYKTDRQIPKLNKDLSKQKNYSIIRVECHN